MRYLLFISILFLPFFNGCSKKTSTQKKSEQYRKQQELTPFQRKVKRLEKKIIMSNREREAVDKIKTGKPYSKRDMKLYRKYYKRKTRAIKKIEKLQWKHQKSLQDVNTRKRMKKHKKKSKKINRFKRNK